MALPTLTGPANKQERKSNKQKFLALPGVQAKIDAMSKKFGIPSSEVLQLIEKETGGSYSAGQKNFKGGGARGLIQFLGDKKKDGTVETFKTIKGKKYEIADLAKMDELEQLDVVEIFFQEGLDNAGQTKYKPGELSLAVAAPAFIGKDDAWIENWGKKNPTEYKEMMVKNPGWVKDGKMNKSSITEFYTGKPYGKSQSQSEEGLYYEEDGVIKYKSPKGNIVEFENYSEYDIHSSENKNDYNDIIPQTTRDKFDILVGEETERKRLLEEKGITYEGWNNPDIVRDISKNLSKSEYWDDRANYFTGDTLRRLSDPEQSVLVKDDVNDALGMRGMDMPSGIGDMESIEKAWNDTQKGNWQDAVSGILQTSTGNPANMIMGIRDLYNFASKGKDWNELTTSEQQAFLIEVAKKHASDTGSTEASNLVASLQGGTFTEKEKLEQRVKDAFEESEERKHGDITLRDIANFSIGRDVEGNRIGPIGQLLGKSDFQKLTKKFLSEPTLWEDLSAKERLQKMVEMAKEEGNNELADKIENEIILKNTIALDNALTPEALQKLKEDDTKLVDDQISNFEGLKDVGVDAEKEKIDKFLEEDAPEPYKKIDLKPIIIDKIGEDKEIILPENRGFKIDDDGGGGGTDDDTGGEDDEKVSWLKQHGANLATGALGLLAGAQGVKSMRTALQDLPIEEGHKLDAAWKDYMSRMREMSQSGLTAQEKASAKEELSSAYNLGVKNVMRAAGGSRASFLANVGVLNANRVKGLLKVSAMDAATQRQNMQHYGQALKYQQEHDRSVENVDRTMAYNEVKRKSDLHAGIGGALIATALDSVNYAINNNANPVSGGFASLTEGVLGQDALKAMKQRLIDNY